MDATAWLTVSIIGYSLAGVLMAVTIFLFIKMKIPALIGELTGRTAAKQIQAIREQAHSGSNRAFLSPFDRLSRPRSGRLGKTGQTKETAPRPGSLPTEVIAVPETVLLDSETTELLSAPITEELPNGTREGLEETTVLDPASLVDEKLVPAVEFKLVKDIKVTHTNEVI
ncbi:hypothetical protein [Neobacillus muris]|uniref:hypothetical protein n=1 Tax=Neobacillus muris TaxID=2941334 RepID=UPI00203CB526|nr:hypothetical protein [Neobacillus muris]